MQNHDGKSTDDGYDGKDEGSEDGYEGGKENEGHEDVENKLQL